MTLAVLAMHNSVQPIKLNSPKKISLHQRLLGVFHKEFRSIRKPIKTWWETSIRQPWTIRKVHNKSMGTSLCLIVLSLTRDCRLVPGSQERIQIEVITSHSLWMEETPINSLWEMITLNIPNGCRRDRSLWKWRIWLTEMEASWWTNLSMTYLIVT